MATPPDFSVGQVLTAAHMDAVGLWKVGTFTASAQTTLTCDNIFTSDYLNYKVVISMGGSSNSNILFFEFINTSGSIVNASYYSGSYGTDYATTGATAVTAVNSVARVNVGYMPSTSTNPLGAECTIYNPRTNDAKMVTGQYSGINSGVAYQAGQFYAQNFSSSTQMRGIRFSNTAGTNMTGTVRVYGYRN